MTKPWRLLASPWSRISRPPNETYADLCMYMEGIEGVNYYKVWCSPLETTLVTCRFWPFSYLIQTRHRFISLCVCVCVWGGGAPPSTGHKIIGWLSLYFILPLNFGTRHTCIAYAPSRVNKHCNNNVIINAAMRIAMTVHVIAIFKQLNSQFSWVACSVISLYSIHLAIHDILKGIGQGVVLVWGERENYNNYYYNNFTVISKSIGVCMVTTHITMSCI